MDPLMQVLPLAGSLIRDVSVLLIKLVLVASLCASQAEAQGLGLHFGFKIGIGPNNTGHPLTTQAEPPVSADVCGCGCGRVGCKCGKTRCATGDAPAKKPVIYVFGYKGCGPCAQFDKVEASLIDYEFKHVELQPNGSDWGMHKVELCPTFRFADGGGRQDVVGFTTADKLTKELKRVQKPVKKSGKGKVPLKSRRDARSGEGFTGEPPQE
jgi:hypothetical protein